jgi:hypothetical protein
MEIPDYDELGVDPEAPVEDVRRAYRNQIKIFHPDRLCGQNERVQAEAKVRRLNEILEILADPERRRAYDRQFLSATARVSDQFESPFMALAAIALFVLSILMCWIAADPARYSASTAPAEPRTPERAEGKAKAPVRAGWPSVVAAVPADPSGPVSVRGEEVPDLDLETAAAGPPEAGGPNTPEVQSAEPIQNAPGPVSGAQAASAPVPEAAEPNPFEGTWLSQPGPPLGPGTVYRPKYIELRIAVRSGKMHGRYRSSYEVHDQALSPSVNFDFEGPLSASPVSVPWFGPGDARGVVELKLLNPANLRIDWRAEQTSPDLDLVAGAAILVKRLEQ